MSEIAGAGAAAYQALGGLFRVRLNSSKDPKLQKLGQQLAQVDARANALNDIINPKGFVGADGKMKYIPGISFSNKSAIFSALQQQNEISDANLKRQIDFYAKKRAEEKAFEQREAKRKNAFYETEKALYETRKKRYQARASATEAYLERAFGINKKKTAYSSYNNSQRVTDKQIFGANSGGAADYNAYTVDGGLTLGAARSVSYDWVDQTGTKTQSIALKDYLIDYPSTPPATTEYIVRLVGKGAALNSTVAKPIANGALVPTPTGSLSYTDSVTGNLVNVSGSAVVKLDRAELDSIQYNVDFTHKDAAVTKTQSNGQKTYKDVMVHDYLAVTAIDESNPADLKRGYINKISFTKGKIERKSSEVTSPQVFHAKMFVARDSFFNKVRLNVEGTFIGDGAASGTNAADGTLLDLINEGKLTVFAREFGYTQKLKVDLVNSKDNSLVLAKSNSIMMSDGIELFFEVPAAYRNDVDITRISTGDI